MMISWPSDPPTFEELPTQAQLQLESHVSLRPPASARQHVFVRNAQQTATIQFCLRTSEKCGIQDKLKRAMLSLLVVTCSTLAAAPVVHNGSVVLANGTFAIPVGLYVMFGPSTGFPHLGGKVLDSGCILTQCERPYSDDCTMC